jgi:xanthine dehydrogenase accessory factor
VSGDVFGALEAARREGRTVVMGTTVRTEGDPPSAPGNRALFGPDGALLAGTIGCNGLDRRAGGDGAALLGAGERSGVRRYTSFEGEPGEGVVEVFLEAFGGRARLVVGGAGPVADALAAIGEVVGLAVRAETPGSAGFGAASQGLGPGDAVVFVDHDDPELLPALTRVLAGRVGYVGVMGSRRHTPGFVERLRQAGVDVGRLRSPTGLDLGARQPPEIALSILAEVMAATRGRPGGSLDIVQRPSRQLEPEGRRTAPG